MKRNTEGYATVNDLIEMLQHQADLGRGDYVVICNSEYTFAKKGEVPTVRDDRRTVDYGGYDG